MSVYSIFDIADWFLNKPPMSHKKLQKLCYFTYAWYYALNNKPLFDADFVAWIHGPVNRELYNELKTYAPLAKLNIRFADVKSIDETTNDFLERIWETYSEFSAFQLEDIAKYEMPFKNAYKPGEINIISIQDMKEYYLSIKD